MEISRTVRSIKKAGTTGKREKYNQACDPCFKKRIKCSGIEPVCQPCSAAGQKLLCRWTRVHTRKLRSMQHGDDTQKLVEVLRQVGGYAEFLETLLEHHSNTGVDFRAFRPTVFEELVSPCVLSENVELDFLSTTEENSEEWDEIDDPTKEIRLHTQKLTLEEGSIHCYGIAAPFRFRSFDPSDPASRFPAIAQNSDANYVLMVDGVPERHLNPHFDWSRYLPHEVPLDRKSHDRALDLLFKFFTPFCLRIIPALFLRDMCVALQIPSSQERPKTSHYSPMLHNALLALALTFLDDPKLSDPKTRQYFFDKAKSFIDVECHQPNMSAVRALSFLGSFYGAQGKEELGFMYFGLSNSLSQKMGLSIDCSHLVKMGIMEEQDRIDRNWTFWANFANGACWQAFVGWTFGIPLPDPDFPMPFVDTGLDQMPWEYASGHIPAQPCYLTKTFEATCALSIIARCIMDVLDRLNKTKAHPRLIHDQIHELDIRLNKWHASLTSELEINSKSCPPATPVKLSLHLSYWWLVILLHRPFFQQRACSFFKSGPEIDHIKLCQRAAEKIMSLFATWHSLYGLRYCPITLIQKAFAVGTVYILTAMQACCGIRVSQKELRHALNQQKLVMHYLHEIGHSWSGATKIVEILFNLTQDKLMPILARRRIHIRNGEFLQGTLFGDENEEALTFDPLTVAVSHSIGNPDQLHRWAPRKGSQHTPKILGGRSAVRSSQDSTLPTPIRPPQPENSVTVSPKYTSWESSSPSDFVHVLASSTGAVSVKASPDVSSPSSSFDWQNFQGPPVEHYFSDPQGFQHVGSSRSFEQVRAFQATSYSSGPELGGFSSMLDGQSMSFGPLWNQLSLGGGSLAPVAVMDDMAYSAASLGQPLFAGHEVDEYPFLTSSEANVMDTAQCVDHFTQWVNSVSREFC